MPESAIRSFFLDGPSGRLEALLNSGRAHAAFAAVVCHPHPRFGGTMHNKVVFHAMKALNELGWPVLRFNFRGTGLSEGEHAGGEGEVGDVRAALAWLEQEFHRPIVFTGFSFGAAVGLRAAYDDNDVAALIALGAPVRADSRQYNYDFLESCTKPKLFASGENDQYASAAALQSLVASLPEPKQLVLVPNADHFFAGRLEDMKRAVTDWLKQTI